MRVASTSRIDHVRDLDGTRTSRTLLLRVRDWRDTCAWTDFFWCYRSRLEDWCREQAVDPEAADEICQRIWIELSNRMRTFEYDPKRSFRGWLRALCRSRTIDYLRQSCAESRHVRPLDESAVYAIASDFHLLNSDVDDPDAHDAMMQEQLREAQTVQDAVQKRVTPQTWEVFWKIAIEDRRIRDVATEHKMSYAAAFAAWGRVQTYLREQGASRREVSAERIV